MSVLIKGMIKPRNCAECDIDCGIDYKWLSEHPEYYDAVPTHCPIIEVPPHGRLIDADALKSYIEECKGENAMAIYATGYARGFIDNAPTVIPADKDGET